MIKRICSLRSDSKAIDDMLRQIPEGNRSKFYNDVLRLVQLAQKENYNENQHVID